MWRPICTRFMNRAEVSWFSVKGSRAFPSRVSSHTLQSHTGKCQRWKGKNNPKQNKYHMDQCTAYQNNFQFGDNGLSQWSLQGNQSCLGHQEWIYWEAFSPARPHPCPAGLPALASRGWQGCHRHMLRLPRDGSLGLTDVVLPLRQSVSAGWPPRVSFDRRNDPSSPH